MDIERAEALWRLGELPVGQLQRFARQALADGCYGPALQELAEYAYFTMTKSEAESLFERALREMGRSPLSTREAGLQIARGIANDIVSGRTHPYDGARRIWQEVWQRSGRPDELLGFVGLASQYEDNHKAEHRRAYLEDIVREAKRLLGS